MRNGPKGVKKKKILTRLLRKHRNCPYCGSMLTRDNRSIDHVVPKALIQNGANDRRNMVLCCKDCNNKKGDTLFVPAPPERRK